jgi:hemolysin III
MTIAPHYVTPAARAADAWVHVVGVALAMAGAGVLLIASLGTRDTGLTIAVLVYAGALVALFACSAAYNFNEHPAWKPRLRRLDHAVIFLMIAGTYTPFTTQVLQGRWGLILTALVWTLAAVGITIKLFLPHLPRVVSVIAYLLLGWVGVVAAREFGRLLPPTDLWLLALGGIAYTVGVPFYLWKAQPYRRALWHGFVIVAAALHFVAVLRAVVLPASASPGP